MSNNKGLTQFARRIQKSMDKAKTEAVNRAASNAKSYAIKLLAQDTGTKTAIIGKRIKVIKASASRGLSTLSFAVKVGISLGAFTPKRVRVDSARGKRTGVSVSIAGARETVPGAWLFKRGSTSLVLARKQSYTNANGGNYIASDAKRKPLIALKFDMRKSIEKRTNNIQKQWVKDTERHFNSRLTHQFSKLK